MMHSKQDLWHLRVTAGKDSNHRYVGSIVSDTFATFVKGVKIESNDQVNISESGIDFNLQVGQDFEDGLDFQFPTGASLSISLEGDTEDEASLFRIGSEKWPVTGLPLNISGW